MGRCEWNPTLEAPSFTGFRDIGCQNDATLSVGGKATALHLCESCAALPRFKRHKKGPIEIPAPTDSAAKETEAQIQTEIKKNFKALGYICLSTSTYAQNRSGATDRAIPDLMVTHPSYPPAAWIMLEVKTPEGKTKPEQLALLNADRIRIVRSWDEAWAAVRECERWAA